MDSKKKRSVIFLAILSIILLIILLFFIFKFKPDNGGMYGDIPGSEWSDEANTESDGHVPNPLPPSVGTKEPEDIIYPENVDFWEESLTGGGIPQKYKDAAGNEYVKKYFPSLGYAMYIPEGWERIEHSNSYLQNIYYLVSDKEGYEDIQISVATKTATAGLSPSEVRNLFRTTHNNIEYYYRHGEYKFITTMYEADRVHQITTKDIPGFEDIEDPQILVYYDEPKVTFIMEKEPTYFVEPYVINYYIVKDNVAVMLTVIGPRKYAANMNYLLTAMGLNCKELYNKNANRIKYSADKTFSSPVISIKAPSEWLSDGGEYVKRIKCSDDETNALYGTEILFSNKLIEKTNSSKPQSILSDSHVTSEIAYSTLDFYDNITGVVLQNLNYSIRYTPNDISSVNYGKNALTKIDFTCTIEETSLFQQLALVENPFKATIYIKETSKGYVFVAFKYNAVNGTYIESFIRDVLENTTWPD